MAELIYTLWITNSNTVLITHSALSRVTCVMHTHAQTHTHTEKLMVADSVSLNVHYTQLMGSHLLCCDGAHVGDAADPSLLLFIGARQELKGQGSQSSTRNYCWLTASAQKRVITLTIHTDRDIGWGFHHLQFINSSISITSLMYSFLFESINIISHKVFTAHLIGHGCITVVLQTYLVNSKKDGRGREETEFRASVLPNHSPLDWTL